MNGLAVGIGAALGAWLRWGLNLAFHTSNSLLPIGTLLANLGGGFLAGIAMGFFEQYSGLNETWRLLLITGFLGGLTTFSTFSIESLSFIQRGEYLLALGHSSLHLIGSIALCLIGWWSYRVFSVFN